MDDQPSAAPLDKKTNALKTLLDLVYLHTLPAYGNSIFYGLGFLAFTALSMLLATGTVLAVMGTTWWLHSSWGIYLRSVHLWSVQALIAVLVLHMLVAFTTSAFKAPRRMIWVFGATMFCLILIQTEFGYGLRGDFSSQFRAVSGADFWNGAYLGHILNPLSTMQEYALHISIIPITILLLFIGHFLLIKRYGIAKPYRADVSYRMVPADHTIMWARGAALVFAILVLAGFFPSPYVEPVTIASVAQADQHKVAKALFDEFARSSDTATYLDSIDPYTFDTRDVYVVRPYEMMVTASGGTDAWKIFSAASPDDQQRYIDEASKRYPDDPGAASTDASSTAGTSDATSSDPILAMINTLEPATSNGLYEAMLNDEQPSANYTYSLRFLNDMSALEDRATELGFSTEQGGMAKDENGHLFAPAPGSWWLSPLWALNSAFDLPNNDHGDRIAAEIFGLVMLLLITFPYIPYLNRIPEWLHIAPFIWRRGGKTQ